MPNPQEPSVPHRHRRRRRHRESKRMLIITCVFSACVFLGIGILAFVMLRPHRPVQPKITSEADKYITVGKFSVTVVNMSDHDWAGGTLVVNGTTTFDLPPIQRNQMREFPFRHTDKYLYNRPVEVRVVTLQTKLPDGSENPTVTWTAPQKARR